MNDVIIQTSIGPIVKGEIDLHKQHLFVCLFVCLFVHLFVCLFVCLGQIHSVVFFGNP